MPANIFQERFRARAEARRAEGVQHVQALEKAEKGSYEYEAHARKTVELAAMAAMLDIFSRPPSGGGR
jgi:hypothetical protein